MNNLHQTFEGANLNFEITEVEAEMIQAIVSFKLGQTIKYDDLTILQVIQGNYYTVEVNSSGHIIGFGLV